MGADEKSNLKRCGEILINIKKNNKKTKIYTFNCGFCNANWDQLKKFSLHIEEKHFDQLSKEDDEGGIYTPDIKSEELKEIETNVALEKNTNIPLFEDPLKTNETITTESESTGMLDVEIKEEHKYEMDFEDYDCNKDDIDYQDFLADNDYNYSDNESSQSEYNEEDNVQLSKLKRLNKAKADDSDTINESTNRKKGKKKSSPLVDIFMECKTNVTSLIEIYENHPNLWNKDSPHYRFKDKRQQHLQEITEELNTKQNLSLKTDEVAEIISHICRKHRRDFKSLENQDEIDKNGKKYKRCWYFKDLHFLRPKENIQLQKLDMQLPDLVPEQILKILEIYQGFSHLWNTNLIEYIGSNKRNEAIIEMLKMLETNMNLKITKTVLEEYLRTIHNYFSKEKRLKSNNTKITTEINNTPNYYEHMAFLYDHEGPFTCSDCNRVHLNPLTFRVHKSRHDGSMPLICSQCNKEFKNVALYTRHAKRHLEDREFVCKECDKKFLNHKDLEKHMLTHAGARPYCCEICGAAYRHFQYFKNHQRRHEKRFTHTCHICSKGYYSKDRYDDHMNSHLGIRSHICKVCGKAFITSRALRTHSVTHEDVRKHACNLCGKTFKLKIGVLQHLRTHGSSVRIDENI